MFNTKNISDFLVKHQNFQNNLKTIHVGGTNGKGSVSHMIEAILSEQGYRVGLYTSPYDFKRFDNIRINRVPISDQDIKDISDAYKVDFKAFHLSEFERDTVIALEYFYDQKVDFAVIEVGLGGVDDATNVISPLVSVITNIGTDHQDVLGQTKREIATKKAGIIKPKTPVVIGYGFDDDLYQVFQSVSVINQAPLWVSKPVETIDIKEDHLHFYDQNHHYELRTQAYYQLDNASVALKTIEVLRTLDILIDQKAISNGLKAPLPAKRFEWISRDPLILMDGAHNLEGINALIQSIKALDFKGSIKIICGILKDKPYLEMIEALKTISKDITLTTFDHPRALDLNDAFIKDITLEPNHQLLISSLYINKTDLTIITGSLYFLSAVNLYLKEKAL